MNRYRTRLLYMPYEEVVDVVRSYLKEKLDRTRGTCLTVSSKEFFLRYLGQSRFVPCEAKIFWDVLDELIKENGLRVLLVVDRKCGVAGRRGIKKKVLLRDRV